MKHSVIKIAIPVLAIVVLLIVVAWMAGFFTNKLQPGTTPVKSVDSSQAVLVIKRQQAIYEPVPGSIEAKQSTVISSRILARIDKVHVHAGEIVQQGQLLIELEQSDLQSRVSQAKATGQSVSARLKEAKQVLARVVALVDKKLLPLAELDKAQANHNALVANLANVNQAITEAEAALGFAKVTAPIGGRIVDRFAEPGDTAQPGIKLLSLYNPSSLRVEANVREQLVLSLEIGQPVSVSIPALEASLQAEIEELVPAGNAGSRSFLVKSRLQEIKGLLPGMYAQLQVPAGSESLLLIPQDKVAKVGQLDIVWVAHGGALERRLIRTGKTYPDGMIHVISGLAEGEAVMPIIK